MKTSRLITFGVFLLSISAAMALGAIPAKLEHALHLPLPAVREQIRGMQTVLLLVPCGLLAAAGIARHPAARQNYQRWLMTTPWRAGMLLPLGPVTPSAGDIFALAVSSAAMHLIVGHSWILPFVVFAGVYALVAMLRLTSIGPRVLVVALWLGFIGLLRTLPHLNVLYGIVFVLYGIAHAVVILSLRTFPWGRDDQNLNEPTLGLGYQRLSPRLPPEKISTSMAISVTLILAWAAYCVTWCNARFGDSRDPGPLPFIIAGLVMAGLLRCVIYSNAYHSPISLWGRLWTLRWIIPGYDYVLLGPGLTALAAVILPAALMAVGAGDAVAAGITVLVVVPILIFCPPTLNQWRFTGAHRINVPRQPTSLDRSSRSRPKRLLAEPQ